MNIAFLFNSDHPMFNGFYGLPILKTIIKTNVFQNTNRNIKISEGDILTFSAIAQSQNNTYEAFYKLNEKVYTPHKFNKLIQPKLQIVSKNATIHCIYIKNILKNTALALHEKLICYEPYLGAMDIDFNNKLHARFFEYSLVTKYRIFNKQCSIFYSMGEFEEIGGEEAFQSEKEIFSKNGFNVIFEDTGAINTIFDKFYANYSHLLRIQDFKNIFLKLPNIDDDILDNIIISLEELHPKLFNSFASMAKTFDRIETEEDIAQCSISGRRFLEQLSYYLFPPRQGLHHNRKVGKSEYKNRLWAYISDTVTSNNLDNNLINEIGKQLDKIIDQFNKGLHGKLDIEKITLLIENLLNFVINLVTLSPNDIRKPYLAYQEEIETFMDKIKSRYI
ncbi:hypothetical protein [Sulfurimonas hydrogeniphila]|uniref:hypothetical protein n=1 Tax=Sulfurimonas hydrogeniphila TaxID=2509341 RepID=UPI00125FBCDC|nr:hypothetical protein [Sulfurimonas hydrogeniphila]